MIFSHSTWKDVDNRYITFFIQVKRKYKMMRYEIQDDQYFEDLLSMSDNKIAYKMFNFAPRGTIFF